MRDDYEAKKIREYIWNLMKSSSKNECIIESVISWAKDQPELLSLPDEPEGTEASKKTKAQVQQMYEIVLKAVTPVKTFGRKTTAREMDQLIQSIGTIFHLTQVEKDIFGLAVRATQYEYFNDLLDEIIIGDRRSRCGQLNIADAIARLTGRTPQEISSAINPQSKLLNGGLIEFKKYRERLKVCDKVRDLFSTGCQFSNQTELKNYLIGKSQISTIDWVNFAYLGKDRDILERVLSGAIQSGSKGINILFHGKPGTGKTEFCRTLAQQLGVSLYAAAEEDEDGGEPTRSARLKGLRFMQEVLTEDPRSCILFDEAEDVFGSKGVFFKTATSKVFMNRQLEENSRPVFWLTNDADSMDKAFLRRMTYCLEFGELPLSVRVTMSQKECEKKKLLVSPEELLHFVREYDLPPAVFSTAVNAATLAGGGFAEVRHVVASAEKLLGVKRNNAKARSQFDICLINADIELAQITSAILRGGRRDFSFCLSGPPGTGKSEFARWLAMQLDMDVLFKRASDLISKWVGETEKNISAAFQKAETQGKMLIFDEADSLLYSRREAQKSWEVAHVNEMLTWMEQHSLPFICTTNLSEKIDEAAFRRFTFKTRFDYLKREQVAAAFHQFFGQGCPENALGLNCLTPGDFAVVKKKVEYYGNVSTEEIGHMLYLETLAKPVRLNLRKVGFKT